MLKRNTPTHSRQPIHPEPISSAPSVRPCLPPHLPRTMRNRTASLLVLSFIAAGCSKKADNVASSADSTTTAQAGGFTLTPAQREKIHIVVATASQFQPSIEATGTVAFNGDRSTQVLAPISGPVTRLFAEVGTRVSRGTPLAAVSSPDFADAIAEYRQRQFHGAKWRRLRLKPRVPQQTVMQHSSTSGRSVSIPQLSIASGPVHPFQRKH